MTFPTAHPVDNALSVLRGLVHRGRNSSLTPEDLSCGVTLLDHDLGECGADPDGLLRARLQMLWRAGKNETLTLDQFEAITTSIRKALLRARDGDGEADTLAIPLPAGVEARRVGRFTVVQGGLNTPQTGN